MLIMAYSQEISLKKSQNKIENFTCPKMLTLIIKSNELKFCTYLRINNKKAAQSGLYNQQKIEKLFH